MQQALVVVNEIKRLYTACIKSKSPYLKRDYEKKIRSLKRDLKEYCFYRKFNYKKICQEYNI